jgi:glycosyltransferase involved in cell wall biosynthesis
VDERVGREVKKNLNLSIITPCYNEEQNIESCIEAVRDIMRTELPDYSYEHLFIDNCSTDSTVDLIRASAATDSNVKLMVNNRNIGVSRSIYRAVGRATGEAVIPMLPADLQDPVSVIPKFVANWESGSMVVFGQRIERQESILMRVLRGVYYRSIRKLASSSIPINAGEFMLIDSKVAHSITAINDQYPYVRGLVAQADSRSSFVKYRWERRIKGKSKSTPFVLIDVAINGLVSTSRLPARISLLAGFVVSFLGFALGLTALLATLIWGRQALPGITTILISVFMLGGFQLFFLGLIGEYVLSIHSQVRPEPLVYSSEEVNMEHS